MQSGRLQDGSWSGLVRREKLSPVEPTGVVGRLEAGCEKEGSQVSVGLVLSSDWAGCGWCWFVGGGGESRSLDVDESSLR